MPWLELRITDMKQNVILVVAAAFGLSGCADSVENAYWPWNWADDAASTETADAAIAGAQVASSAPAAAATGPYTISYLEQGRAALAEDSPARAERAFRLSLAHEGESALALTGLGVAYDRIGRPDAARVFLERAVDVEPDSAIARNNLGVHHWRNGDIELAVAHLERGAELSGDNEILARNLELVATMRTEPVFDGGFGTEDDVRAKDRAFSGAAEGVEARVAQARPVENADRLDGFALVRSGSERFELRSAVVRSVTAPQKPRYHLYDPRVAPDGL